MKNARTAPKWGVFDSHRRLVDYAFTKPTAHTIKSMLSANDEGTYTVSKIGKAK